jgi:hypothetical protein
MTANESIVAVRLATREQVASRDWYRWYPESHRIDIARSHPVDRLLDEFRRGGFDVSLSVVDESRWVPISTFQDMMTHRAFSVFRLTDPADHRRLSEKMLRDTSRTDDVWFSYEMSWLIARPR